MLSDEVLSYFTSRNFEQVAPPVDDLLIHLIDSGATTVTINVTPSETGGAQSREWGKVIAGSAGSSVLRMNWLGDAELTSIARSATCSGVSGRPGGSLIVLGVVGTTFSAIETGSGAGKKLLTRFTP